MSDVHAEMTLNPDGSMLVVCPLFAPVEWSIDHPEAQVPYHLWLIWDAAHVHPAPLPSRDRQLPA